ncbi:MAG TPA: NADH-quinone oxidoreductase subunit H [Verrucomicrobiae bacterium]|nr:NADH-quinone oxidoreductase subunit H [Verrucomicrobiae bacterium]
MKLIALLQPLSALVLSPVLLGVINRTKAWFAGRSGQPLLQPYYDLGRLLRKGAVYSRTTTWVFRGGPIIGLAAVLVATTLVPLGGLRATLRFSGDLVLFAYLLGLTRLFAVLAALDTGSSFEGIGASREVTFSALAEPALLLGLAALARQSGSLSLSTIYSLLSADAWLKAGPMLALVVGALMVVFLAENARIPVDDPTTHLELTMIHEVMVLDHSGPDLAFILYGAALKLWVLGSLLAGLIVPVRTGNPWLDGGAGLLGMLAVAVAVGIVESSMARLRLPQQVTGLLVGAGVLAAVALILSLR